MELHLILLFMIFASLVAIEASDLLSSIIALSTAGLGLSLAFLILKAPSLAIVQLVVEILCLIILIRATINKDLPLVKDGRWFFNTVSTLLFILFFLVFAYCSLRELPAFGRPLMLVSRDYFTLKAVSRVIPDNIICAITLGFRSYDSLAEAALLFTGIIAVLAITRKQGKIDAK